MSDINNIEDVSEFEEPPRHPTDIERELQDYRDEFAELFEMELDWASLDLEDYIQHIGATVGNIICGLAYKQRATYQRLLIKSVNDGIQDGLAIGLDNEE